MVVRSGVILAVAAIVLAGCQTGRPTLAPVALPLTGGVTATARLTADKAVSAKPGDTVSRGANGQIAIKITVALRPMFINDTIDVQVVSSCGGTDYEYFAVVGDRKVQGSYNAASGQISVGGRSNTQLAIKITVALRPTFINDTIDVDYVGSCADRNAYAFSAVVGARRVSGSYDVQTQQVRL